ncbi:MAG: type I methionyl aminopeptidase [Bacteroidales bacterium]|jgi:methionyl aminopeptidase|nr:type I methionyl aminopeptidase [Bacteroidales bacterium]
MIHYRTTKEIALIQESAFIVGKTLGEVAKLLCPGVSLKTLDKVAETFIRDSGAIPSFKGYNGFPSTLCLSVNDVIVHGIPSDYQLKDGDIISVDCGAKKNGYHADYAYTFMIGNVAEEVRNLCLRTKKALYIGIEHAKAGNKTGDIGHAIQTYCEAFGYGVVRELTGHGCGRNLHEDPAVPNYGQKGCGAKLKKGMVFCIEPMINLGVRHIRVDRDQWTTRTADRFPSAHYEHMVALTDKGTEILSSYQWIYDVLPEQRDLIEK